MCSIGKIKEQNIAGGKGRVEGGRGGKKYRSSTLASMKISTALSVKRTGPGVRKSTSAH